MRTVTTSLMHFVSLRTASTFLGARSHKEFLKDLKHLSPQERREVADMLTTNKKEG
jgi:hypothetical protein